jgi:hypothetical protein
MASDNVVLNPGSGGSTLRTLVDASNNGWPAAAVAYAITISPGANVLQVVTSSAGLPVAQQGTWTFQPGNIPNTTAWLVTGTGGVFPATQSGTWSVTATQAIAANLNATVIGTGTFAVQASQAGTWTNTVTQATAANLNATVVGTGTFAVQAAQTGSWTVAATQSGAWTNTVTQATAANLNATVIGTGTFAVQASQTGTWNIGAVTSITNPLPAGTNLLGSIAAAPAIAVVYNGTTAVAVKYAAFTTSSSGATTIVPAVGGQKVYLLRWSVSANGNTNVNLQSHTTTSQATGIRYLTQYASGGGAYCPAGIIATATGEALDVNNSSAIAISGEITYVQF